MCRRMRGDPTILSRALVAKLSVLNDVIEL